MNFGSKMCPPSILLHIQWDKIVLLIISHRSPQSKNLIERLLEEEPLKKTEILHPARLNKPQNNSIYAYSLNS